VPRQEFAVEKRLRVGLTVLSLLSVSGLRCEAATRTVCAAGCAYADPQAAIDAAGYGDTILLRAGETFTGHYILRAKSGTGWIEIRSDAADASLPRAGVRLVPSDRGGSTSRMLLPRIVGRGGTWKTVPLLRTEPGAHGYLIKFLEFDGTAQLGHGNLIELGQDTTATAPYDIGFDRVYVHGNRYKGQKRGIALNARRISVLNSYISDIKAADVDSQAIAGWNGGGPFTIENNYLEASGENMLFGGADPAVANLVPSDITIRRNHFFKPLAWRNAILPAAGGAAATAGGTGSLPAGTHYFRVVAVMATGTQSAVSAPSAEVSAALSAPGGVTVSWTSVPGADKYRVYRGPTTGGQNRFAETTGTSLVYTGAGEAVGTPAAGGTRWVVKNLFEVKNGARITLDGNIFENCWEAGQAGYAILLTPRNSGAAPWTRVQDITFTNNIARHVAGVVNILGYDTQPTQRTERITFRNNLFEDVNRLAYGAGAMPILAGKGAATLIFDSNTIIHTTGALLFGYGEDMPGLTYTNNNAQHHDYGIIGQGTGVGTPTLNAYFPGAVVRCNVFAGGNPSRYPTPNGFPTPAQWTASFVDPANGNYALRPGSPVALAGCNGVPPGANMPVLMAATGLGPPLPSAPINVRVVR
jgi:hypothetical protein